MAACASLAVQLAPAFGVGTEFRRGKEDADRFLGRDPHLGNFLNRIGVEAVVFLSLFLQAGNPSVQMELLHVVDQGLDLGI